MIKYLKELLNELKNSEEINFSHKKQKIFALENAIEILENLKIKGSE